MALEAAKLSFRDEVPAQTADIRVAPLDLRVANLSTEKRATGTVDLRLTVDRQGTVAVAGPFGIEPLRADLALDGAEATVSGSAWLAAARDFLGP